MISFPLNGLDGFDDSGSASGDDHGGAGCSDAQRLDALRCAARHALRADDTHALVRTLVALAKAGNVQAALGILEVLAASVSDRGLVRRVKYLRGIVSRFDDTPLT